MFDSQREGHRCVTVMLQRSEGSGSFLKKRTKKLWRRALRQRGWVGGMRPGMAGKRLAGLEGTVPRSCHSRDLSL